VFYCLGRDSWFSVNAAMSAKKMGYSQVGWYRGGFESWKAAKLPTGSVVVRAVAN
jgi:rhodanese-related sulfurtransferase